MFEGQPKGLFALALANTGPLWQVQSTVHSSCWCIFSR